MTTIELRRTPSVVIPRNAVRSAATGTASLVQPAKVALVAAAASVPPITMLHLNATGAVEPATWTISDYVVTLPYGVPLFAMTTGALAIGAVVLARGLAQLAATRLLRVLLGVWAAALMLAAVFPTNLRGTPQDFSSNVHLIAGAVVFAVLPAVGVLVVRRQQRLSGRSATTVSLAVISSLSGLLSAALILNRLPGVIGMPELMLPPGVLRRAAGAVEIVLLGAIAFGLLWVARGSR